MRFNRLYIDNISLITGLYISFNDRCYFCAKWILISELKMDEQGAHRYIEKHAMDRCISKREIAEEIIETYS